MRVAKDNETCRELDSSLFVLDLNDLSDFTVPVNPKIAETFRKMDNDITK